MESHQWQRLPPTSAISQSTPYRVMQAAIDLHETGVSPQKYFAIQERIRNAPSILEGIRHLQQGDAVTGGGFSDWITRGKHWLMGTKNMLKEKLKSFGPLVHRAKSVATAISSAYHGQALARDDFPREMKAVLEQHGVTGIKHLFVARCPIKGMINKAMNLMSFGQWNKSKGELPYDDIYHLYLGIELETGQRYILEKDTFVVLAPDNGKYNDRGSTTMNVTIMRPWTLGELVTSGLQAMGVQGFFSYNGFKNNCQHFINGVLEGSARRGAIYYPKNVKDFVMQNTEALISSMHGGVHKFMDMLETASSHADMAIRGAGLRELARKGIAGALHITDLRRGTPQANDRDASIHATIHALYPLTGLMSGSSAQRGRAAGSLPDQSTEFIRSAVQHILTNSASHQRHPLVTDKQLQFIASSPDDATTRHRIKIVQAESGQGLLSDLKTSTDPEGGVLHSWVNQNIMHPIYNHVLRPALEARATETGQTRTTLRSLPGGGVTEDY